MKKVLITLACMTVLLTGCTKEEAPKEPTQEPVTQDTLHTKLVWFDKGYSGSTIRLSEITDGKYENIGSDNIEVAINTTVTDNIIKHEDLLYDAEYDVTFKDGNVTSMSRVNTDEDVWKTFLTNGKYNIVKLQGTEDKEELNIVLQRMAENTPNLNVIYDTNMVKSIRDYKQYGVEVGDTCIVVFNGYNYLGTIMNEEDYIKIKDNM